MIDEFGSGNLKRAHTTLYIELLRELGMPTEVAHYLDRIEPACFAFVNLFFWLCLRADDPSYFAGTGDRLELCFARWYPDGNRAFRQIYRWRGEVERAGRVIGRFAQCMDEAHATERPATR